MAKRTNYVTILPHWRASDDVLLKALVANGGELYAAMAAVDGQVGEERSGPRGLWLQYSRITDAGMEALANWTSVREFESSKHMTDAALVHLAGMVKMSQLTLNEMRITGDGLRHLAGMSKLKRIQMCQCVLTDSAMSNLPALPALSLLNLTSSTGCSDAALECVTRLPRLEHLSLNGAPAAGPGLKHLAGLRHLRQLDLSGGFSRITTDADLAHLPPLPAVDSLSLRHTYVTDAGLVHLARLPGLRMLSLDMTAVSDGGVRHLAMLSHLELASFNNTQVTLQGVRELQAARPGITVSAQDCSSGEGGVAPQPDVLELIRRPEAREPAPVARSWMRIEAWFAQHLPAALATLRPPAKEGDLAELEQQIGRPLPADLRASYLIHDGQTCDFSHGVLFGLPLSPINDGYSMSWLHAHQVEHEWPEKENWMLDWTFYPSDAIREAWSGPGWVPFYWDVGRNFIGVDLEPGPNGVVGQVIPFGSDGEFRPVLALSFAHLLEDIADELEAGHAAVDPPEVSHSPFRLKGAPAGYFSNAYKEWAEAKLPRAFQQAQAVPRFVPEDHATPVGQELAAELVAMLRAFLTAMNEYERRWLAVRPIHEYGVSYIYEFPQLPSNFGYAMPREGERPANRVQEILWNEQAAQEEKRQALSEGKYRGQAVSQKNQIWRRFLTSGERPNSQAFFQQVPCYYDPAALLDPDVRLVSPDHAIISYGSPKSPDQGSGAGRLRWHLRFERDRWWIERHESIDDPAKPRKLDLR